MDRRQFQVAADDDGRRLDRVIRKLLPSVPLGTLYRLIRKGAVRLDGKKVSQRSRVTEGQTLSLPANLADEATGPGDDNSYDSGAAGGATAASTWDVRPMVLVETEHYLALGKPKGALVHGDGGLDDAVRRYLSASAEASLSFRPGPLHRLDRNTSGVLLFSKTLIGAQVVGRALSEARKRYIGLVDGTLGETEEWTESLSRDEKTRRTIVSSAGANAHTTAQPILRSEVGDRTLVLFTLHTGRTHQIRAHADAHGHPLSGDRKYGGSRGKGGYVLHAWEVIFAEPPSAEDRTVLRHLCLVAPMPIGALAAVFERNRLEHVLARSRSCKETARFATL